MQTTPRRRSAEFLQPQENSRRRRFFGWLAVILVVALVITGIRLVRNASTTTEISAIRLACSSDQDITPFGDSVLAYDGTSIHCLGAGGGIRWSIPVGTGAKFSVSERNLVVWSGTQLFIVDYNGNPSYNESLNGNVQFARVGTKYVVAVIGEDTHPDVLIKNLDGTQVDEEIDAFNNMMMLDAGFYGDADQYLWTMAMDIYSTAINTRLNTFQVGKMNTGETDLGEFIAYRTLYENGRLRVLTTQQMYTYDYKAVQDMSATQLVYGWELVDWDVPARGDGLMLLAPTSQIGGGRSSIQELRILSGTSGDRRYTTPSACVGAAVKGRYIYGIASNGYLYRGDVDTGRFTAFNIPLEEGVSITGFAGLTTGNHAIILCGSDVYSVTLPR